MGREICIILLQILVFQIVCWTTCLPAYLPVSVHCLSNMLQCKQFTLFHSFLLPVLSGCNYRSTTNPQLIGNRQSERPVFETRLCISLSTSGYPHSSPSRSSPTTSPRSASPPVAESGTAVSNRGVLFSSLVYTHR